jgi:hypothetical protein
MRRLMSWARQGRCVLSFSGTGGCAIACAVVLALAPAVVRPQSAPSLDGLWRSDGYGLVFRIAGDSLDTFEVTAISCIPSYRAHRTAVDMAHVAFLRNDIPETFELRPGATADTRRFHVDGAASEMIIRPIRAMPGTCGHPVAADPTTTFDVLWQTYHEQYPFFELRHVDWAATRARLRSGVGHDTPAQLFATLRAMIEPLHDSHTYIGADDPALRFHGQRPDPDPIRDAGRQAVFDIIAKQYLRTPLRSWANRSVSFAMLADSIGYLRVTSFSNYVPDSGYLAHRRALDAALDTIFAATEGWRGLVIDVRINGGGDDPLGLAIAERLTAAPYTAYAKVARSDAEDPRRMTPPQPSIVQPSARPGWHGPVVELTSRYSVSAAETFTQALMGRRPAIARIGENTQGVFSDILGRSLPNGWHFGLPNELFLTEQGTSFDGPGIPPTIPVPTFMHADIAAGRDPGLERAVQIIRSK